VNSRSKKAQSVHELAITLLLSATVLTACTKDEPVRDEVVALAAAEFVGSENCGSCHEQQLDAWSDSHHDLAMQHANADTVLGDFNDAKVPVHGVTSSFFRRGDDYIVNTDAANGEMQDFRIAYTFGVYPLQQYLVEFPDGRLQALSIAWDSRPESEGGQRWYHLYGEERIAHDDPLHWTTMSQNWNYMCAECHSTDLARNYDLAKDSFATTWSEINVGCEGCHGPGSNHVNAAKSGHADPAAALIVDLDDRQGASWIMDPETGIASRSIAAMKLASQPEACGRCHSRRAPMAAEYEYGKPLLDTHLPALLDDGLYFADGQVHDEVYVYGSFLQSRMYQAGVSCSDCHDPHSTALKTGGNPSDVCATCHLPAKFASTEHQRHAADVVECVDCHMASRTYMGVDARRDHSFRIPRPDLTVATGSPNACNNCHSEQSAEWASAAIEGWFGAVRAPHFATAIHAGRSATADANEKLLRAIDDDAVPGIARATALTLLLPPFGEVELAAVRRMIGSPDAMIRLAAIRSAAAIPPEQRGGWIEPSLDDPILTVRFEAFQVLSAQRDALAPQALQKLKSVEREYIASQLAVADRPDALVNIGNLARDAGELAKADDYYRLALQRHPQSIMARVNLADSYARQMRNDDAITILREGLAINAEAESAALHHALGLTLVRVQQYDDALVELQTAATLEPSSSRYTYVYAIGLNSLGRSEQAIDVLRDARNDFPADFDIAWALVTLLRDQGRLAEAREVAFEMLGQYRQNDNVIALLESLQVLQ
jgi:tetratricopeptide (TPR) repeat protein